MEERKPEAAMVAGEIVAPKSAPVPPFSASWAEQLVALGMYAAA